MRGKAKGARWQYWGAEKGVAVVCGVWLGCQGDGRLIYYLEEYQADPVRWVGAGGAAIGCVASVTAPTHPILPSLLTLFDPSLALESGACLPSSGLAVWSSEKGTKRRAA